MRLGVPVYGVETIGFPMKSLRRVTADPSWGALLYRTAAEEIGINRLLEKHRLRSIPHQELADLYAEIGLQAPGPSPSTL